MTPSVEIAKRLDDTLEVSLDCIVGTAAFTIRDKKMMHRLELLEQLDEEDRAALLKVVDHYLTTAQRQQTQKKIR